VLDFLLFLNVENENTHSLDGILGIGKNRTLNDGRKVSEIKTRGQQVYLNGLDLPVF
jgi:hypothetical protein